MVGEVGSMKFSVITLFPQMFDVFADVGVVGRAVGNGIAEIELSLIHI